VLNRVVLHEIGHALGLHTHLACHNVMAADISCEITADGRQAPLMQYTPQDRAAICAAGVLKGICNSQ
jgi:predicted Zn-dependent protease